MPDTGCRKDRRARLGEHPFSGQTPRMGPRRYPRSPQRCNRYHGRSSGHEEITHSRRNGHRAGIGRPDDSAGGRQETQHPHHLGRRHRRLQHQRLQPGHDGLQDAEHRPHRQGRRAVHRLVRPAELHRRSRGVHHRPVAYPHRPDQGRPAGRARGAKKEDPTIADLLKPAGTPPASSARTTSATATRSFRPFTGSTSSSATSIT